MPNRPNVTGQNSQCVGWTEQQTCGNVAGVMLHLCAVHYNKIASLQIRASSAGGAGKISKSHHFIRVKTVCGKSSEMPRNHILAIWRKKFYGVYPVGMITRHPAKRSYRQPRKFGRRPKANAFGISQISQVMPEIYLPVEMHWRHSSIFIIIFKQWRLLWSMYQYDNTVHSLSLALGSHVWPVPNLSSSVQIVRWIISATKIIIGLAGIADVTWQGSRWWLISGRCSSPPEPGQGTERSRSLLQTDCAVGSQTKRPQQPRNGDARRLSGHRRRSPRCEFHSLPVQHG